MTKGYEKENRCQEYKIQKDLYVVKNNFEIAIKRLMIVSVSDRYGEMIELTDRINEVLDRREWLDKKFRGVNNE